MKAGAFGVLAVVLAVLLAGCTAETVVTTGIVAENAKNQMQAVQGVSRQAGQQIGLSQVQQAINAFQAMEGRYPYTLDELVQYGYLYQVPQLPAGKQFVYNNVTGEVRAQVAPPTQIPQQQVMPQQQIPPGTQGRVNYGGSPYLQQFQIQHEFQYDNQAQYGGAYSANLGAKRQLGNIQRNYQQQQNQYVNELVP
jgi:hypothetical protein